MQKYIFIAVICLTSVSIFSQGNKLFIDDFKEKWANAESYTLACLALMPDSLIGFKPVDDALTFRKMSLHILQNMIWLSTDYMNGDKFEHAIKDISPDKSELISLTEHAFKHTSEVVNNLRPHDLEMKVDFFAGEKNVRQILILMNDHLTHHRAQLAMYLRLNGIKPPKYRGW